MQGRQRGDGDRSRMIWIVLAVAVLVIGLIAAVVIAGDGGRTAGDREASKTDAMKKNTEKAVEAAATGGSSAQEVSSESVSKESVSEESSDSGEETQTGENESVAETVTDAATSTEGKQFVFEDTGDTKLAYLTFDDGPSDNTYPILDILDQYGVKATFFTIGKTDEESVAKYKEIVNRGHSMAMHSYTHDYDQIYASMESFQNDVQSIHDWLYQVTGQDVRLYRFPGGSSNTVSNVDIQSLIDYVNSMGYIYYDWNVSSGDAAGTPISAEEMVANVMAQSEGCTRAMILMHDANTKTETVRALPGIIEGLMGMGYQIVPITDSTKPVQHKKTEY